MLIMHCARCEKRCYKSTPDKGNHGLTYHQVHLTNRLQGKPDVHAGTRRNNVP